MLRVPLLLALASLTGACRSTGYQRASATADKTESYRESLVGLREQVSLTTEALRTLSENPGDSPRSNRETYETFARELANLSAAATRAQKKHGRMGGRAERFFGAWSQDSAALQDAELKQSAENRRAALQAQYETLRAGQHAVELALEQFTRELGDLRLYLEHDLTAAGIASARATIERAFAHGTALRAQLEEQARASDLAHEALAPLKDQAPARPREAAGQRVR